MPEKMQVYKCELCGNIVEVLHGGGSDLVCCGENMVHVKENTVDAAKEKHVPVVEKIDGGFKISVGSVPHPMEEKHYIEWIEASTEDGRVFRKFLSPGMVAEAVFMIDADSITAREYCNLHGLWKG
ncbi:MAG: desulfoferrodoxin [Desulfocapsa sp.]|uniref:Desulfoferrodoxin n=1 Tax=Desulfotalea psychrophila TaxID=84980 RepID=A0ABS3AVX8_9BACT|nr:desulfoferrodoxin [Desulfocapsa sp.]MBN4068963.1 desulfoferrodoxin [Desulfotalea psychrophila]